MAASFVYFTNFNDVWKCQLISTIFGGVIAKKKDEK